MYDIAHEYLNWLCQKISEGRDDTSPAAYSKLLAHLFNTSFYSEMGMDKNRSSDGLCLRDEFSREEGSNDIYLAMAEDASVLEVLVALARRIDHDFMYDIRYGDRTSLWFWIMIENLGLNNYDDAHYNEYDVDKILTYFMDRRYGRDGRGSLFPIRNDSIDVRNYDIWYQMNAFFSENSFYWE